jgi:hypothetical protein
MGLVLHDFESLGGSIRDCRDLVYSRTGTFCDFSH